MQFGICTLDEFAWAGKTVLCRVDINQPIDLETGALRSTARIRACVPTVRELAEQGAKVVLLAHQGSDIEYQNFYSTQPHAAVLTELLGRPVQWIDDVCGPAARQAIEGLSAGEVLLLDNVRFLAEEQTLFERHLRLTHPQQANTLLVRKLAPLADAYVCDAFAAAHRDQPSLCGFAQRLPSAMGRLFQREYSILSQLMESPERPCVFLLGGAKISDAFMMMETVLGSGAADTILTGGVVGNILLAAAGQEIGSGSRAFIARSGYEPYYERGRELLGKYGDRIRLPLDLAGAEGGLRREYPLADVPETLTATDIGSATAAAYGQVLADAKTVFVNGPMGVFEQPPSAQGTRAVWQALGETAAFTVVGGGDSITATAAFDQTENISHICTGGGALIRFLSGEELPVVRALREAARRFG